MLELEQVGAKDSDTVFYDYMSLPQDDLARNDELWQLSIRRRREREAGEQASPWPNPGECGMRTEEEKKLFRIGLKGVNLLYTFKGCRVLIIPEPPFENDAEGDIVDGFDRVELEREWSTIV